MQKLITELAVETLDEGILLWFAWSNIMPFNDGLPRPEQDCHAGKLGAIMRIPSDREGIVERLRCADQAVVYRAHLNS